MSGFAALAGSWEVHALGWTLLHLCWQGALVALVLWCALQWMRGAAARYAVCCVALGLMVVLPVGTFLLLAGAEHGVSAGGAVAGPGMVFRVGGGGGGTVWERAAGWLDGAAPWVLAAWFCGAVVFVGRLNLGLVAARRLARVGTSAVTGELAARFEVLKERMGVRRVVRLLHSARVEAPAVVGWLRPVVLVPMGCLVGLTVEQVEAVLCHELAHVRRHDYAVSVAQGVVEALGFYHPGVWWVSRQVRRERECCCDDAVVMVGGDRLAYAKALTYLEARRTFYPDLAPGANGGVLTMRIQRLLGMRSGGGASQVVAMLVLTGMVAVAAGSLGSMARGEAPRVSRGGGAVALEQPVMLTARVERMAAPVVAGVGVRRVQVPVMLASAVFPASSQEPSPAGPPRVSGGLMAGQLVSRVNPVYPQDAKRAGIQGPVILKAVIATDGTIKDLSVVSGPKELTASAIDAVKHWVYQPYLLNGQATEVLTTITVNYSLADGPEPERIGGAVSAPVLTFAADPSYTEEARAKKISGFVLVALVVDQQGIPTHVRVVKGLDPGLDEKAVEAVNRYRFKPAMKDGAPVRVEMNIEVNFRVF